ncbi:MAG TPA: MFS transporter [Rhizomicrobium sp.]|jgi:MFS family permease
MPERPLSYRDLLGIADLPALLIATTLVRLAARMFSLAIVLYALERFSSPSLAGWIGFAAVGPGLMISPLAGALLDRIGPVSAIAVDVAVSAALILALVAADSFGWTGPAVLLVLVALFSLTSPLGRAGIRTLLPRLVPANALDRANALDTAIYAVTDVIGPGLAGLLIGFFHASVALIVIAVFYGSAAFCISRVRRLPRLRPPNASFLRETLDGIVVVVRQPTLRGLAISYSLYQVSWGVLVIVVPVFALRAFAADDGSTVAGFMWAASGLAGGVGALVAGHLRTAGRERGVMAVGMILTALASWPIASEFGFGGLVLGLLIAGAASGPVDVGVLTLRQRRTDPGQLGRVLSVSMSLNIAGFPLGSALAGILITHSLPATFLLAGIASALAAFAVIAIPRDATPS